MQLIWNKCTGDVWCNLLNLNLDHPYFFGFEGVYVIWHGGQNPATVYVGQGNVAERLEGHRTDSRILAYSHYGLFVTWARVGQPQMDGVERYLADSLKPKVGEAHPAAMPITVNFPW